MAQFTNFWLLVIGLLLILFSYFRSAEVLLQDVLWSREYEEGLNENYYGMCTFVPSPCGMSGGNVKDGVCVQRDTCYKHGGINNGDCQNGMGECCRFTDSCKIGRSYVDASQLVKTIETPEGGPTAPCTIRIPKEPKICQVRLDFLEYMTESAGGEGDCKVDKLRIKNSVTVDNDFITCGTLTGQHMYLTFGEDDAMTEVTPALKSPSSRYRITITKIPPCNSGKRAPDHCLQYYTGPSDTVQSFDFGRQQQNNQRYTICAKPTGQATQVQWRPCGGLSETFDITTDYGTGQVTCDKDWVEVKRLERTCRPFVQQVSSWKSFELMVNFDEMEYPPPPPSFFRPIIGPCVDSPGGNCASDGMLTCGSVATQPSSNDCHCTVSYGVGPGHPSPDFNNTGFCLEYSQV